MYYILVSSLYFKIQRKMLEYIHFKQVVEMYFIPELISATREYSKVCRGTDVLMCLT